MVSEFVIIWLFNLEESLAICFPTNIAGGDARTWQLAWDIVLVSLKHEIVSLMIKRTSKYLTYLQKFP